METSDKNLTKKELIEKYPELLKEIAIDFYKYTAKSDNQLMFDWPRFIEKINRQPIIITEDGKELFEGDKCFYITTFMEKIWAIESLWEIPDHVKSCQYFSTRELAEEYLIENAPNLSLKDVKACYELAAPLNSPNEIKMSKNLKQLIKQRLGLIKK